MIGTIAFTINIQPATAAGAELKVTPPLVNKNPEDIDSFFDVFLELDIPTGPGLYGFDIRVTWGDNTLIMLDNDTSNANTAVLLDEVWGVGHWYLVKIESSGGGGGGGYYRYVALSTQDSFIGTHNLMNLHFQIKRSCNFVLETPIHIDMVKLSDANWTPIPATTTDGLFHIGATTPDLELEFVDLTPSKPFEYCKIFYVKVYVSHICAQLTDYIIHISYTSELLKFTGVSEWGILGDTSNGASVTDDNVTGEVQVQDTGGLTYTGDKGLLFTLAFHVEFDDREEHIWRVGHPQSLPAQISIQTHIDLELSFVEGVWPISLVQLVNNPISKSVVLIRGDVGPVDGTVTVFDLRTVANYYDQSQPAKYDITNDGLIDIFDLVAVATNIGY